MTPLYIPIVRAKKGEFQAFLNVDSATASRLKPLFELPQFSETVKKAKRFDGHPSPESAFLDELVLGISQVRRGMRCYIDSRSWAPNATVENGEHVIGYAFSRLQNLGVFVDPVINYDFWDDPEYRQALSALPLMATTEPCIRLESDALDEMDDQDFFMGQIGDMLLSLGVAAGNCSLLIDFSDVTDRSVVELQEDVEKVLSVLGGVGFRFIAMSGCSIPANIAEAVEQRDSTGMVLRKEVLAWKALKLDKPSLNLVFGDYAIRNPKAIDAPAPDANGKIRYTVDGKYFVVRGHSRRQFDKGYQTHRLAQILVESPHYLGEHFSWGDSHIMKCAKYEVGPGAPVTWIAVDTSHHLKTVVMETMEFVRNLAPSSVGPTKPS